MNLGQLRKVLQTAEGQYRQDGRGDVADALSSFSSNLLRGNESVTVSAFVSRIEKARRPPVPTGKSAKGRKRK